jgi:hypothetical protein
MNSKKIATHVMAHYEKVYGNYAVFSCSCGRDDNGTAYTFVVFNESAVDRMIRVEALARLIEHAEYDHVTPSPLLITPPPVTVNIVKFDI